MTQNPQQPADQPDSLTVGRPGRRRRITAMAVAGGVVVLGAGIGAASLAQADPTPSPSPSASSSAQPGQPGGPGQGRGGHGPGDHGGRGGVFGADTAELAAKLGVTEAKLTEALKAIREENKPTKPSASPSATPSAPTTRPDPAAREAAFVKALAAKLGLDEAKVKAAVDAVKASHQADEAKQLKTRLDAAVKAGTLTQAEADAVTKAVEKGVIHAR